MRPHLGVPQGVVLAVEAGVEVLWSVKVCAIENNYICCRKTYISMYNTYNVHILVISYFHPQILMHAPVGIILMVPPSRIYVCVNL